MPNLTKKEFQNWFGSDHIDNVKDLTNLIMELINRARIFVCTDWITLLKMSMRIRRY